MVKFHQGGSATNPSLTPTATATDPPPAKYPLCTVGKFARTKKPKEIKPKKNH